MSDARRFRAWREVCMAEYRITGDMMKATAFADSVEQRIRAAALREAADLAGEWRYSSPQMGKLERKLRRMAAEGEAKP